MFELTPTELRVWLEWAGARLIAMPGGRIKPAEPQVIWPEYSQEKFEILDYRPGLSARAAAPSSFEIPMVDEILTLPNLCSWQNTRRVLHVRALVHPISGRYLYNWTRVARLLSVDHKTVKAWHKKGLIEVVTKADQDKICRISAFLANVSLGVSSRSISP